MLAAGQTAEAAKVEKIASQPQATWFTGEINPSYIADITFQAQAEGKVPVYVVYDLPWRGCNPSGAGGGASSPADYQSFIDDVTQGIGHGNVVIVVEPDALAELSCLPTGDQDEYYELIEYALENLGKDPNAHLYVDAGHPNWEPVNVIAQRLTKVLTGTDGGFALNVSNYYSTASNVAYGTKISQATGGRHFVIDTGRNGGGWNVTSGDWCNPPQQKLGADPTSDTGNPLVDAELWIKPPGTSDGSCNGGPPAGDLWLRQELAMTP